MKKKILTAQEIAEKKEKKRLYDIEYRKRNKEKIAIKLKTWSNENPEMVKEKEIDIMKKIKTKL